MLFERPWAGGSGRFKNMSFPISKILQSLLEPVPSSTYSGYLNANPNWHDFKEVRVGRTASRSFHINNSGDCPVEVNISVSGPFSSNRSSPIKIPAHNSVQITITYKPTSEGRHSGFVSINAKQGIASTNISLSGTGTKS